MNLEEILEYAKRDRFRHPGVAMNELVASGDLEHSRLVQTQFLRKDPNNGGENPVVLYVYKLVLKDGKDHTYGFELIELPQYPGKYVNTYLLDGYMVEPVKQYRRKYGI